ncbi:MAG: hypothetical protein NZ941_06200, partial [Candidatus Caldarchaeum sp.]|nr:hypothetical protein [Candidatus Caldarchaeum sp.]
IQSSVALLMVCALLVGVVVGAQESVFRAVVAQIAEKEGLGGAYGAYGLAIGVGSAAAGVVYGFLIEVNAPNMVVLAYAASVQAAALAIFFNVLKRETVSK